MASTVLDMKFSKFSVALLLSLVLALGAGLTIAHSHDGHDESHCVFSVAQNTVTASASACPQLIISTNLVYRPTAESQDTTASQSTGFLPRAPPSSF